MDIFLVSPPPTFGERRIHLRHRHAFDRVVLVHIDGESIDRHREGRRFIFVFPFKGVHLGGFHGPRHRPDLRRALNQGRWGGAGPFALDLNFDVGILFAKSFSPEGHEIVERIRAYAVDIAGHPADFDVGFQGWVELDRVIGKCQASPLANLRRSELST